ncbi:MAG: DUF4172 domain-containing protein [Proteobacteria bacterium]|nr:DUF4172 domain-containing protein [Pseudomonadota bacterium]
MATTHLKSWIWQHPDWPAIRSDAAGLARPLAAAPKAQGELTGNTLPQSQRRLRPPEGDDRSYCGGRTAPRQGSIGSGRLSSLLTRKPPMATAREMIVAPILSLESCRSLRAWKRRGCH